jgi:hypothetical protein
MMMLVLNIPLCQGPIPTQPRPQKPGAPLQWHRCSPGSRAEAAAVAEPSRHSPVPRHLPRASKRQLRAHPCELMISPPIIVGTRGACLRAERQWTAAFSWTLRPAHGITNALKDLQRRTSRARFTRSETAHPRTTIQNEARRRGRPGRRRQDRLLAKSPRSSLRDVSRRHARFGYRGREWIAIGVREGEC